MAKVEKFCLWKLMDKKTAYIVENYLDGDHIDAIRRLEEDQEFDDEENYVTADKRLFSYMRGLLEPCIEEDQEEQDDADHIHQELIRETTASQVDNSIQERYIELMCRFDPSGVFNYFSTKLSSDISFEKIQKCCEEYGVIDAVVWIMEKNGDTSGALDKMLEVAKEKNSMILLEDHDNEELEEDNIPELSRGSGENSSLGNDSNAGFRLLDAYVEASIDIYNVLSNKVSAPADIHHRIVNSFKSSAQSILTSLLLSTSPQVSLPRLLSRLITSQARGETTFADFREIFLSMLDTYKYEGQLLELTNRLFDRYLFGSL
ncbi:hypothetical protein EDC96DRAFT_566435 [Choanephora cucurbitarum]|nr:hypothetical protein EDC96DRAFT_566435 [Choanephora cucurbitarum]